VEGYIESTATGLLAALNIDRRQQGLGPALPPPTTMLGGLLRYLREADPSNFQPMNANFGLLDPLPQRVRGRRVRREELAARALREIRAWTASAAGATADAGR
jgi:methylenetetrahydrofolate--tRNA-(uracil-5-)-methyltransferase